VYRLLLLVIALIVYVSLFPWQFDFAGEGPSQPFLVLLRSWPEQWGPQALNDAAINLVFYFPLGLVAFLSAARCRAPAAQGAALGAGLVLSISMELLQVYVPGRVTSSFDVLCNFVGTAAGALVAWRYQPAFEALVGRRYRQFVSSGALLLACWTGYQLWPFFPKIDVGRLPYEVWFLFHPQSLLVTDVWANMAEWFVVTVAIQSLTGRLRPWWMIAVIGFRIVVRPFTLNRPFALDELLGAVLALLLWSVLSEKIRLAAGLGLLAVAIVLRELTTLPFSHLAADQWPGSVIFRRAFDAGAGVWLLNQAGVSYVRAGALVVIVLAVFAGLQRYMPGKEPSLFDPILAGLMASGLLWADRYGRSRVALLS